MKEYHFIPVNFREEAEFWKRIDKRLKILIKNCQLITTNYGVMYRTEDIKGVGDSFRGPTIEFVDGGMTYHYNVRGGYAKDSLSMKRRQQIEKKISWPMFTRKEINRSRKNEEWDKMRSSSLAAGYSVLTHLVNKINKAAAK